MQSLKSKLTEEQKLETTEGTGLVSHTPGTGVKKAQQTSARSRICPQEQKLNGAMNVGKTEKVARRHKKTVRTKEYAIAMQLMMLKSLMWQFIL